MTKPLDPARILLCDDHNGVPMEIRLRRPAWTL